MPALRPYQQDARAAVRRALAEHRSTLCVLPTGTGKTHVMGALAADWRPKGRVLVLTHRIELLTQTVSKLADDWGLSVGVEAGKEHVDHARLPRVVVASTATLAHVRRRDAFRPDAFALILVDEGHHATATSYRKILAHFPAAKVVLLTATPDRADGVGLGHVCESVAYAMGLATAIRDGWLVPIYQRDVVVQDVHLEGVRVMRGDLDDRALEAQYLQEKALHGVAKPLVELTPDMPTMVFTAGVKQAHALAATINRYAGDGRAVAASGETDPDTRKRILADYREGRVQYLVNCGLWVEGIDLPQTQCIAIARPTLSRALYAQMVGRGTRPSAGKTRMTVLDFVGNDRRHALVSVADLLAGSEPIARGDIDAARLEQPDADVMALVDAARATVAYRVQNERLVGSEAWQPAEVDEPTPVMRRVEAPRADVVVPIRLSAARMAVFHEAAARAGMDVSVWARSLCDAEAARVGVSEETPTVKAALEPEVFGERDLMLPGSTTKEKVLIALRMFRYPVGRKPIAAAIQKHWPDMWDETIYVTLGNLAREGGPVLKHGERGSYSYSLRIAEGR